MSSKFVIQRIFLKDMMARRKTTQLRAIISVIINVIIPVIIPVCIVSYRIPRSNTIKCVQYHLSQIPPETAFL
jgi:hypothetical protein